MFALMEEPARIAPLMGAVAERHVPPAVFAGLSRRISAAQWSELARAALHASGIPVSILENAAAPGIAEVARQAQRMLRTSILAQAVAAQQLSMDAIEIRRAFATLIALEQDPAALRESPRARSLVSALSDAMHPAALRPSTGPPPKGHSKEPWMSPDEDMPSPITRRALTNFGGLLFLLRTIEALNLPEEMLARCPRRPFRWILHQLALALARSAGYFISLRSRWFLSSRTNLRPWRSPDCFPTAFRPPRMTRRRPMRNAR
jgi:hypothetical protein